MNHSIKRAVIYCCADSRNDRLKQLNPELCDQLKICQNYATQYHYQVLETFFDHEPDSYVLDRSTVKCMLSNFIISRAAHALIMPSAHSLTDDREEQKLLDSVFNMFGVDVHCVERDGAFRNVA